MSVISPNIDPVVDVTHPVQSPPLQAMMWVVDLDFFSMLCMGKHTCVCDLDSTPPPPICLLLCLVPAVPTFIPCGWVFFHSMFVSLVATVRTSASSFCFVCAVRVRRRCLLPFSSLTLSWRDLSSQIGHTDQTVFSVGRSSTSHDSRVFKSWFRRNEKTSSWANDIYVTCNKSTSPCDLWVRA